MVRPLFRGMIRLLLIAGGVLIVGLGAVVFSVRSPALPSDGSLGKRFQTHRADFERLAAKAVADRQLVGMGGLLGGFDVWVKDTPNYDRRLTDQERAAPSWAEYRRLLKRAGLPSLSRSRQTVAVTFVMAVSVQGQRKGYIYSEAPLEPVVRSLDGGQTGYVELGPRWYLFRDVVD